MCGVVGIFLKNAEHYDRLGVYMSNILDALTSRGPDSVGVAIYDTDAPADRTLYSLYHPNADIDWVKELQDLPGLGNMEMDLARVGHYGFVRIQNGRSDVAKWLETNRPDFVVMGEGQALRVVKQAGAFSEISTLYGFDRMRGSHAIGHTRMATESAVSTAHAHPFSAGDDICLVHNGSLSNHNRLRRQLTATGMKFQTDNDSEVAAKFIASRLREGLTLKDALEECLDALDGFYTFAVSTRDGFAVLRDPIACKPATMAETDDWVALASEYRALCDLP
jgi:amidophosphoribosyltransferase